MSHRTVLAFALFVGMLGSVCAAQDFSTQMLTYFPGKWILKAADGTQLGTADWKLVSGGKALAGPGVMKTGGKSFALAGWDSAAKKWIHNWFQEDGGYGYLEVVKYEGDTYFGIIYLVDAKGKSVNGDWQTHVIDKDHFETIQVVKGAKTVTHFYRTKD